MPLYYITGSAGSGKSSVQQELKRRGFSAYDSDDPEIGSAHDNQSNKPVAIPPVNQRSPEWFAQHNWKIYPDAINRLRNESRDKVIFLCGSAANEYELLQMFDESFYLDIDDVTLQSRIKNRDGNDYGKSEDELQVILDKHQSAKRKFEESGAKIINAAQPLKRVVDEILEEINR